MKKSALTFCIAIILTMTACNRGVEDMPVSGTPEATTAVPETVWTASAGTEATAPAETEATTIKEASIPQSAYDNAPSVIIDSKDEPFGTVEDVFFEERLSTGDGYEYRYYSMSYPKVTLENKTAEKKINDFFVNFEASERKANEEAAKERSLQDYEKDVIDSYHQLIEAEKWSYTLLNDSGNILSLNMIHFFEEYTAAHGMFYSNTLNFDVRTGELIDGGKIVTDIENVGAPFAKGIYNYSYLSVLGYYEDFLINDETVEEHFIKRFPENFCVKNGSICVALDPYELGSFGDGIRYIPVPLSEMEPYLTDYAKDLFSNTTSSTAVKTTPYLENGEIKYSLE